MITTGYSTSPDTTKTEIVDVVSGETCADLADFPLQNCSYAVGANLDGTPVVCGGYYFGTSHKICYKLTNSGWQEFASMKDYRGWAAAVMFQKKFHVFGGWGGWSSSLQTSEIIGIDGGVEYGPELPSVLMRHAITSVNSTTSILSGGSSIFSTNSYSPVTWYFNHETNVFSSGPSLLEGRVDHGSATCVDKVTKARIPIVTGGYKSYYSSYGLDSTELLINEQWQSGTILFMQKTHKG